MTQPDISNKSKAWKRGLMGGFISALLGGGCFSLLIYPVGQRVEGILMFLCLGFGFPALIDSSISNFHDVFIVTVFWFLAGTLTAYFARNNKAAIGIWLLGYAVSLAVSIALFANMMN